MFMPDNVYATIKAFYDRFGLPEGEEAQRAHHGRCCQTVHARHFGRWGWKRADPNRPPSADAIAFDGERLFIWDCVFDAGGPSRRFSLQPGTEGQDATGQVFIDVEPHDWLANDPPPPPPDVVSPAIRAFVENAIREHNSVITKKIEDEAARLNKRIDDLPPPSTSEPFDQTKYKTRTRVSFLGTFEGSIEKR